MARLSFILRPIATMIAVSPLYALTAIVVYDLVTTKNVNLDFSTTFLFLFFLCFPVLILVILLLFALPLGLYASFNPLRILRALHNNNMPPLSTQPSIDGALASGETILIERSRSFQSIVREQFTFLMGLLTLAGMLEVFLLFFLQPQRTILWNAIVNNTISSLPSLLTIWDGFTLAYPLILVIIFILFSTKQALETRYWSLAIEDNGITLTTGRKRLNIQWHEIQAVVIKQNTVIPAHLDGEYLICTRDDRILPLTVDPRPVQDASKKQKYNYKEGYDRYSADMLRAFATIRARSFATFYHNKLGDRTIKWLTERAPLLALRDETVLELPVAPETLQPQITPVTTLESELTVTPRLDWGPITRNGIVYEALFIGFFAFISVHSFNQINLSAFSWNSIGNVNLIEIIAIIFVILLVILILALFGAVGFVFAYSQQRKRLPRLSIKDHGIVNTQRGSSSHEPDVIYWNDIRAWVLLPTDERHPYDTFVIFYGEKGKLYWRVNSTMQLAGRKVQGDRQAIFQERLREAHTIITAKTGLPLRISTTTSSYPVA
jgi:hypothetical protein